MTEQKLRKFKLIDREGYSESVDKVGKEGSIVWEFFSGDYTEGVVVNGDTIRNANVDLIRPDEFKFFKEVFDLEEDFVPAINEVCEVSRADDMETWYKFIPRAKYTPHYVFGEHYVGDWQSGDISWKVEQISAENFVFRPLQEKTWQEKLCEEFGLEWCSIDGFYSDNPIADVTLIRLAKRIIELSEGGE
ncbi:hypothetical protein NVP1161O_020 [Vibrio phage 1.161.O._10N.261.48.C5]|nr:hypothetical protein NVP1161O_020 [Vibrio phage 1.161.O._10N.261.48.C5]